MKKEMEILAAKQIPVEPEPYAFYPIRVDRLRFKNISTAWKMEFTPKEDPAWILIYNQLAEYNAYLNMLDEAPGFESFFADNGYCLSYQHIRDRFGTAFADQVFSLESYPFRTSIVIKGDHLLDMDYAPSYRIRVPEFGEVSVDVGEIVTIGKAEVNCHMLLLMSWSDDARDLTYGLYKQFAALDLLPEETETSVNSYASYDCYDQHRENMTEPDKNLMRCMELLESRGYLNRYKLKPVKDTPWFPYRDGYYGVIGALDYRFKQDPLLMEKLRLILAQPESNVEMHRYFLTAENGMQYLSDTPGKLGGHRKLKIYGKLDCTSANRHISNGDYIRHRVFFADEATAIATGYRPCAVCMREQYTEWNLQK